MKKKLFALGAAVVLGVGVFTGVANASNPVTSTDYDINTLTWTNYPSTGTSPSFDTKELQCDSGAYEAIGGGVVLTNATSGSPVNAAYYSTVYSGPLYGGSSTVKDSWYIMVRYEPGTGSRGFTSTATIICAK